MQKNIYERVQELWTQYGRHASGTRAELVNMTQDEAISFMREWEKMQQSFAGVTGLDRVVLTAKYSTGVRA